MKEKIGNTGSRRKTAARFFNFAMETIAWRQIHKLSDKFGVINSATEDNFLACTHQYWTCYFAQVIYWGLFNCAHDYAKKRGGNTSLKAGIYTYTEIIMIGKNVMDGLRHLGDRLSQRETIKVLFARLWTIYNILRYSDIAS